MEHLCNRAAKDYDAMRFFTGERLDLASLQEISSQPKEKEAAAIRVAKTYKGKDFYRMAKQSLAKDPYQ